MGNVNRNKKKRTSHTETNSRSMQNELIDENQVSQNLVADVGEGSRSTAVDITSENVRMETIAEINDTDKEEGELLEDDEISFKPIPSQTGNNSANNAVEMNRLSQQFLMPLAPPDPKFMEVGMLNEAMFKFEEMIKRSQLETASMVQKQMDEMKASMDAMTSPGTAQVQIQAVEERTASKNSPEIDKASSEITIYTNAVKEANVFGRSQENNANNFSSSDEENVNTSNENMDLQNSGEIEVSSQLTNSPNEMEILNFITENRPREQDSKDKRTVVIQRRTEDTRKSSEPQPGTSKQSETPEQRADKMVKEAEAIKARILDTPGRNNFIDNMNTSMGEIDLRNNFVHSVMVDESFLLVASHLDQNTYDKIVNGEYVDFSRLIPKDKLLAEEENRMQMINKDGQMFFVPANGDKFSINSFNRWEQAFRVFSDVYTRAHPARSSELVQYNHIIHTASLSYAWDNVYLYDKDFRLHMARHPSRSWGLLLQQAWALRLKDRVRNDYTSTPNRSGNGFNGGGGGGCRRFNRGKCSYGYNCKYDHRCFYCNRNGHGVISCRQLKYDTNGKSGDRFHKDNRFDKNHSFGNGNGNGNNYGNSNNGQNQGNHGHNSNGGNTNNNSNNAKQQEKK